jgi:hypothetical protein
MTKHLPPKGLGREPRYNLWLTADGDSTVIVYGDRSDMDSIAATALAGIAGRISVLPDGQEP